MWASRVAYPCMSFLFDILKETMSERRGFIGSIVHFFDRFEDYLRLHLTRHPVPYTLIGGVATVLFWRGVWHTADILYARGGFIGWLFYEPVALVLSFLVLLATGLFVSFFIGDVLLMTGMKQEKRLAEETRKEVAEEEVEVDTLRSAIAELKEEVDEIKDVVQKEHNLHHRPNRH